MLVSLSQAARATRDVCGPSSAHINVHCSHVDVAEDLISRQDHRQHSKHERDEPSRACNRTGISAVRHCNMSRRSSVSTDGRSAGVQITLPRPREQVAGRSLVCLARPRSRCPKALKRVRNFSVLMA